MSLIRPSTHRHEEMHPLTRARVDARADLGRAFQEAAEAWELLGRGEVTRVYVNRKEGLYKQALERLIEAAQAEGAG